MCVCVCVCVVTSPEKSLPDQECINSRISEPDGDVFLDLYNFRTWLLHTYKNPYFFVHSCPLDTTSYDVPHL